MSKFLVWLGLVLSGLRVAGAAEPTVVADDPFEDGDFFSSGGGDPLGLIWLQDKNSLEIVDGAAALGSGKALRFRQTGEFSQCLANFPAVPLAAAGDSVAVEFDYRIPEAATGVNLRLGLYDSKSTRRSRDGGLGAAGNDDAGYGATSHAGGSGGRDTRCFREAPGNNVLGGPAPSGIVSAGRGGPAFPGGDSNHHLRFALERGADGSLNASCAVDGRELAVMTEAQAQVLTLQFDQFALGFAGKDSQGEIHLDNFRVTARTEAPLASMAAQASAVPAAPEFRTWTNQQGRRIEAALAGYDATAGSLKLRLRDGRDFVLPLTTLSRADAAFVRQSQSSAAGAGAPGGWRIQEPGPIEKREAKLDSGRARFRALRAGHPRLMLAGEETAALKQLTETDPLAGKLYAAVREAGTGYLSAPPLEHVLPDGKRLLLTSREFVARMYTLGLLERLDRDPQWSARAIAEMLNIAGFTDWNPSHFLDVAEMAHGMAIGYDWFYDKLSDSQRAQVRRAIVDKAFAPAMQVYAKPGGWHTGPALNNWNHVCNGGLIVAALAVGDEERREAQQILEAAMSSLQQGLNLYLPDGAWDEGTGYWGYATNYVAACAEALRTATGSDGGIGDAPALDKAVEFMQHAAGATGRSFNFADAGPSDWGEPVFMWMGKRCKRPDYSSLYKSHVQNAGASSRQMWFGAAHGLLWYDREAGATEWKLAPCDRVFRRIEMVSLRTSWEPDAWSISAKGGDNRFNHGNLDLGTFVFDALGTRWAIDLGADNYGLEGYFEPARRFTHYRTSSAGQNTLTWDNQNQQVDGTGFVEVFESTPARSWAVLNLSDGYASARQVRRGLRLTRGPAPSLLIQDELERPGKGVLVWAMHTQAKVACEGGRATLELGGRKLEAAILQPPGAVFRSEEVEMKAPAYPAPDTRKLLIQIPVAKTQLTLAVRFAKPGGSADERVEPLIKWGGKPVVR